MSKSPVGENRLNRAVSVIHTEDGVIRRDGHTVRVCENSFSPSPQDVPIGIQYDHRAGSAVEDVDLIPRIHSHRSAFLVLPTFREFTPIVAGCSELKTVFPENHRTGVLAAGSVAVRPYAKLPILFPISQSFHLQFQPLQVVV